MGGLFGTRGGWEAARQGFNVGCELFSLFFFFFLKQEELSIEGVFISFSFLCILAPEGAARGFKPSGSSCPVAFGLLDAERRESSGVMTMSALDLPTGGSCLVRGWGAALRGVGQMVAWASASERIVF